MASKLVLSGLIMTALLAAAGTVTAAASIPFARSNIRNWRADSDRGIWVRTRGGQWFYGAFTFPCTGLQFRDTVRFNFGPGGELDQWGSVHTRLAGECRFKSFETSAGPRRGPKAPAPPAV